MKTTSGIRYKIGSQICGVCKTKDNIIQFERNTKRKGLPIIEIAFLCDSCAKKNDLLTRSIEVKDE